MQLRSAFDPDLALRIGSPEGEPSIEMLRLETKAEMASHAAPIKDRSPRVVGPEIHNRLQVGVPVVYVGSEDWPEQVVLAGAVVKSGKEPFKARMSADAIV